MTDRPHPSVPTSASSRSLPWPPTLVGQTRIIDMAFHGRDMLPLITSLTERVETDRDDAAARMDLAAILLVLRQHEEGLALQHEALDIEQVYRQSMPPATAPALRVLMFVVAGDFMANIPLQFLLDGSNISLDLLYLRPGHPLPPRVPEHDLAIVGVAESDESRPVLDLLSSLTAAWPTPVLLDPRKVATLSRESLWTILEDAPGVRIPATVRLGRDAVARLAEDDAALARALPGGRYPLIIRPVGSHAGQGLQKIDTAGQLSAYLAERASAQYYLSQFVDYRSADGLFRKYRIAFVDGHPMACHMAMAESWMLHYFNAGMDQSAEKRAEELRWFDLFDTVFAARHRRAFEALCERVGLEYLVIDCAEAPTGELLVFEADTAMVVHAMDSPDLFPHKRRQMQRVFRAFQAMIRAHASRPAAHEQPALSPAL